MKKVFRGDNDTVAHYWANKTQSEASNGGNFFFEGDIIYSYGRHFQIAKHVINEERDRGVLFTQQAYSNTTAKHINITAQACNHLNVIYCKSPDASHEDNFNHWVNEAENIASKLQKATKPEKYLNELNAIKGYAEKYASFFSISIPYTLTTILDIQNKDQYKGYIENKLAFQEAEKKKKEAQLKKDHAKELKKWLNGESSRMYTRLDIDYLRISDKGEVETTQGIRIPKSQAKKFWSRIKDGKLSVGEEISGYTVDAIGEQIKIGCHAFPTDYLIKFGDNHFTPDSK